MKIIYMQRTFPLLPPEKWEAMVMDESKEVKEYEEEQYIVLKINED